MKTGCLIVLFTIWFVVVWIMIFVELTENRPYERGYRQALKDVESKHPTLLIKAKTETDEIFWIENSNYKRNVDK